MSGRTINEKMELFSLLESCFEVLLLYSSNTRCLNMKIYESLFVVRGGRHAENRGYCSKFWKNKGHLLFLYIFNMYYFLLEIISRRSSDSLDRTHLQPLGPFCALNITFLALQGAILNLMRFPYLFLETLTLYTNKY